MREEAEKQRHEWDAEDAAYYALLDGEPDDDEFDDPAYEMYELNAVVELDDYDPVMAALDSITEMDALQDAEDDFLDSQQVEQEEFDYAQQAAQDDFDRTMKEIYDHDNGIV